MKSRNSILFGFVMLGLLAISATTLMAQSRSYQKMTEAERAAFISTEARNIARKISGSEYEFTPSFEANIQTAVNDYARRVNNNTGDQLWKGELRFMFERGRDNAPLLISVFEKRGISPLIGLYIPAVESEYVNIQKPNSVNALGMFQFLPKTGQRYGLTPNELLDVEKSADAAARYIADGFNQFKTDSMKEALALLAYNRGGRAVAADLELVLDEQNKRCSICAITAAATRLDSNFQNENVFYVPRFFAAAIIGENPRAFGLELEPLSSYRTPANAMNKR
jgi:hypothetical protein